MNCDCKQVLEKALLEQNADTESVELMDYAFVFGKDGKSSGLRSTVEVKMKIKGKTKPRTTMLITPYCPHCGKPAEKEETTSPPAAAAN
jgi:hypothetical protein